MPIFAGTGAMPCEALSHRATKAWMTGGAAWTRVRRKKERRRRREGRGDSVQIGSDKLRMGERLSA